MRAQGRTVDPAGVGEEEGRGGRGSSTSENQEEMWERKGKLDQHGAMKAWNDSGPTEGNNQWGNELICAPLFESYRRVIS